MKTAKKLIFSIIMILCGCSQIHESAVNIGISDRYRAIEKEKWCNLKIGCLVFNKKNSTFDKYVCEISDSAILHKLKDSFHVISTESWNWDISGRNNLMILRLHNGEEWKLAIAKINQTESILAQQKGAYKLIVNNRFYYQLKDYLESKTGKRVKFDLDSKDVNSYCQGELKSCCFENVILGGSGFCFWVNRGLTQIDSVPQLSDFYFEKVSDNPYIRNKLHGLNLSSQDIERSYLVYSRKGPVDFSINFIAQMGGMAFEKTDFYKLIQCAIAENAVVLIQSKNRPHPLVPCSNDKELIKIVKKQRLGGYIAIKFIPPNQKI